jgi:gamma-glutamylcyclotransferase (GGCT)/AIG2-like uncharacterized protein YtfP
MERDADRNFPHSKNESNSPTVDFETLNNQLRKGAWLARSFTLSTLNSFCRSTLNHQLFSHNHLLESLPAVAGRRDHPRKLSGFLRLQETVTLDRLRRRIQLTTLMLYFAYGSNMHAAQMKQRCPSAKFVCRGKLPSHRLAFTLSSYSRRCGVADILRDETKEVWGVVYELLENELENLDKDEDFNAGRPDHQNEYTRENHYVCREGDAKRLLLVSLYRGHPQLDPPLPDCDYKSLIVEGARHWQLPSQYIQEIEAIQTA